jgi:LmbE family N-acetylglucosaminyl deacetylase
LGIARSPVFLGFLDGKVPEEHVELEATLQAILLQATPRWILTFHPADGITSHPDHKAISRDITEVLAKSQASLPQRPELHYMVVSPQAEQYFHQAFPPNDSSWKDLTANASTTVERLPISAAVRQQKAMALHQYHTQMPASDLRGFDHFNRSYPYEEFVPATLNLLA